MALREQRIRTALEQHGPASAAGDLDVKRDICQENAVCEYPQSGETNTRQGKSKEPERTSPRPPRWSHRPPHQLLRKSLGTEYVISYEGTPVSTVSIMECRRETQYFGGPFDAPSVASPMGRAKADGIFSIRVGERLPQAVQDIAICGLENLLPAQTKCSSNREIPNLKDVGPADGARLARFCQS